MLRKPDLYDKAITLRYRGFSYNEILGVVPVAQGTISRWCCKIPLTDKQKERLLKKQRNTPLIRKLQRQAIQSKKEAEVWAKEKIGEFIQEREKLLLISGVLLYWAEGTNRGKSLEFTNTDPEMIKIMMGFFRKILRVSENKFRLMVRISNKGNIGQAKKYWLKLTKLRRRNLRRPEILKLTPKSRSLKKHPYGICRIEVHDVSLFRKLLAIIKEFSKNFALVA